MGFHLDRVAGAELPRMLACRSSARSPTTMPYQNHLMPRDFIALLYSERLLRCGHHTRVREQPPVGAAKSASGLAAQFAGDRGVLPFSDRVTQCGSFCNRIAVRPDRRCPKAIEGGASAECG